MAEAELETFTSIMDALVRISVSMTRVLLPYLCCEFEMSYRLLVFCLSCYIKSHNCALFPLDPLNLQIAYVMKECEAFLSLDDFWHSFIQEDMFFS